MSGPTTQGTHPRPRTIARRALIVAGILMALGPIGCATYRAAGIPSDPSPAETPLQEQKDRLVFGVDLPKDGEEIERLFGRNLLDFNVVPLQINLVNLGTEFDFRVKPEDVSLTYEDGRPLRQIGHEEVFERAYYSQWRSLVAWLFILPGFISSGAIANANDAMMRDYERKEQIDAIRLNANTDSEGVRSYLYFTADDPIDLGQLRNRGRAKVVALKSKQGTDLDRITIEVIIRP